VTWKPAPGDMPFDRVGGEDAVRRLAARFYDHMDAEEPELARLHPLDEQGRVSPGARERFALFLVEWLGGPRRYSPKHGHPRLRMRHGRVAVDTAMRDAWLRCMARAMDDLGLEHGSEVRTFLDARFAEVADFLRNAPG
jgi:hemoglobin